MTGRAAVDPEALRHVGFALGTLARETVAACTRATNIAGQTLRDVEAEHRRRERALRVALEQLRAERAALERCLAEAVRSCGGEAAAVGAAEQLVRRRETQLEVAGQALRTARQVESETQRATRQAIARTNTTLDGARRFLTARGLALDSYLDRPGTGIGATG